MKYSYLKNYMNIHICIYICALQNCEYSPAVAVDCD